MTENRFPRVHVATPASGVDVSSTPSAREIFFPSPLAELFLDVRWILYSTLGFSVRKLVVVLQHFVRCFYENGPPPP